MNWRDTEETEDELWTQKRIGGGGGGEEQVDKLERSEEPGGQIGEMQMSWWINWDDIEKPVDELERHGRDGG